MDAICIDGRALPTVVQRFNRRWVVLNLKLARAIGMSGFPDGSVVHEISAYLQEFRGHKASRKKKRVGADGTPTCYMHVEVRGKQVEVMNNIWPVHVAPEHLEWLLGELHDEGQAGRGIVGATSWPA